LGCAFVAGKKRVPSPAAGKIARRIFVICQFTLFINDRNNVIPQSLFPDGAPRNAAIRPQGQLISISQNKNDKIIVYHTITR
jgi:hypothetical protein